MAEITLDTSTVVAFLDHLTELIRKAKASLPNQSKMTLEVPEPYDHVVAWNQPHTPPCIAGPSLEKCADIGILLGVLKGMKPAEKTNPAAPARPKRK